MKQVTSRASSTLKMATCSFDWLQRTTWRYIPDEGTLHNHRCRNLKSYISWFVLICVHLPYAHIFCTLLITHRGSPDSAVGIATGYELDDRRSEFESRYGQEFSLLHVVQTGSGAHPASYPMGTGGSFHGGKASDEIKKKWIYIVLILQAY
jgi:hypothetical protein